MIFIFVLRHCRPKYLVCIFSNFSTYNCINAWRTFNVRFKIGAALNTTSIITRECFHLVSLFKIRNKFMHENIFRHEYGAVSPITILSEVNSGGASPIIHDGKSKIGILLELIIKFEKENTNQSMKYTILIKWDANAQKTYTFFDPT